MKQTATLIFLVLTITAVSLAQNELILEKINQNSLQFSFENHQRQNVSIEYGLTPALELGTVNGLTLHQLNDATFYYAKAKTRGAVPYQETSVQLYATASTSPGDIKVYFNQPVNNNASSIADAIYVSNFEDTLVAYVDRAQMTLDVCNYNTGSLPIVNAINAAKTRGVVVRYIGADNTGTNNDELANLATTIPMIQRPSDGEVMHNKFLIIDVANSQLATIVTGSTNHTNNSCHEDYNNIVIVEDQTLALAYKTEFEEMWGSSTTTPSLANSKFGDAKTDNTPHNFNIGGIPVELYFSPSDGTTGKIESALLSANTDLQFATLTFINNDLGDAVINRQDAGIDCKGIIENIWYFGSEYNGLKNAGVDVYSHFGEPHAFHHKYGIVDANNTSSDPLVITGSHNWTNSAEDDFDENTLIIHDAEIANMYYEEFVARFIEVGDLLVLLDLQILLEGPYQASTGLMSDNLRAMGLIPTTEPYSGLGFQHTLNGGGETVDPTVFDVTGPEAIVDWVFVELRLSSDPSIVFASQSALLRADGSIVSTDGVSPLAFEGVPGGDYYASVKQRNHIAVLSSGALPLEEQSAFYYDFRTGSAFGTTNNPVTQKALGGGLFALFEADYNQTGEVNAGDRSIAWNFRNATGYLQQDSNFDGSCDAAERSQCWNNRNKYSNVPY